MANQNLLVEEIARVALQDRDTFIRVADVLDLSDEYLQQVLTLLNKAAEEVDHDH